MQFLAIGSSAHAQAIPDLAAVVCTYHKMNVSVRFEPNRNQYYGDLYETNHDTVQLPDRSVPAAPDFYFQNEGFKYTQNGSSVIFYSGKSGFRFALSQISNQQFKGAFEYLERRPDDSVKMHHFTNMNCRVWHK